MIEIRVQIESKCKHSSEKYEPARSFHRHRCSHPPDPGSSVVPHHEFEDRST